jgi:hypothetical protein
MNETHQPLRERSVTITDKDRERYQSRVTDFTAQPEPDNCLPTAIKNVLDDLAARKDKPGLSHSLSDLNDQLGYERGAATATHRLVSRIDPLIDESGYESNVMVGVGMDQLETIIESGDRSLPVCDVDSSYFELIEHGYSPEQGRDGYQFNHVVIPFALNEETILMYDPYMNFFNSSANSSNTGIELTFNQFYEKWSRPQKRWTFWLEPMKQQTLTAATQR